MKSVKPAPSATLPALTPCKLPFALPTAMLKSAVEDEWKSHKKFSSQTMPLTALCYTAIDRIQDREAEIIDALMVYLDTDTLSYRAEAEAMRVRQTKEWDPVLAWAKREFGAEWQTTTGIMPLNQPDTLHKAIRSYLETLDAMRLAGACMLASGFSSLVLMLAVVKKHLKAEDAFRLSRLEEEAQAEQWGRDAEAEQRKERLQAEISSCGLFLRLLDAR